VRARCSSHASHVARVHVCPECITFSPTFSPLLSPSIPLGGQCFVTLAIPLGGQCAVTCPPHWVDNFT
jgi:hypothetical protein